MQDNNIKNISIYVKNGITIKIDKMLNVLLSVNNIYSAVVSEGD